MDSNFELPDSTDWISTSLPAFEPLEAALRCEVCKEFLSNPVLTPCSHTFCSICIRRCIATDGKCPSCRNVCSSDKLLPNLAVREVVMRFQEARPKALEMARVDKEAEAQTTNGKKRKLEDTDIEDTEPTRQTRSRRTRSQKVPNGDAHEDPIEVPDSEDGDDDFLPDGMAKCPICNQTMKAEQVYNHLDVCPGQSASPGRSTRSRLKPEFPKALQSRRQEPSPPPTRLSQLNYSMMKEGALRKKLQDLGIPNWGTKDLLKRRHVEWLNIYNSNCDAHETLRKSKRELLRELTEWENTQGGRADTSENKFMKKNFDGSGHAKSHKSDFDDLIARARQQQRAKPRTEEGGLEVAQTEAGDEHGSATDSQDPQLQVDDRQNSAPQVDISDSPNEAGQEQDKPPQSAAQPYANNDSALAIIQQKVQQANETTTDLPLLRSQPSIPENVNPDQGLGIQNPLGSADRKVPMFTVPEQPVRDLDISGGAEPQ